MLRKLEYLGYQSALEKLIQKKKMIIYKKIAIFALLVPCLLMAPPRKRQRRIPTAGEVVIKLVNSKDESGRKKAIEDLRKLANDHNNSVAQNALGVILLVGKPTYPIDQDADLALKYLLKAEEQSYKIASINIERIIDDINRKKKAKEGEAVYQSYLIIAPE